jgi:hypothetical protein
MKYLLAAVLCIYSIYLERVLQQYACKGTNIMKKILLVLIIVIFGMSAASAATYDRADGFGIGLSGGYPVSGVAFKYGMGDFRLVGTIGYSFRNTGAIDFGVQYDLDSFYIDRLPFYLNFGITAAANFGPEFDDFSINIPLGISYYFRNAPIEIFFKLTPGIRISANSMGPDFGGAIGFLYYVNR